MRAPVVAGVLGLAVCGGCYPDPIETLTDSELVVTRFDPDEFGGGTSLSGYQTYARPDVVVPLRPDEDDVIEPPEPPELNDAILAAVDRNLEALGYVRRPESEAQEADVVVLVGAADEAWAAWGCYPGWYYWGWWPGWAGGGPDSAWCYPGSASALSFSNGTLLIDMVDAARVDAEPDDVPVVWSAAINGLLANTSAGVELQIERTIDRAFAQSNYLRVREAP